MRSYLRKFAVALGIVTLACSSGDITSSLTDATDTSTPASVVITPLASPNLIVGTSVSLVVHVRNISGQDLTNLPITWASSDNTVASVTPAGVVSGLKIGTAIISGTAGTLSASVTINVKPVPVRSVSVSVANALLVGDVATAIATPLDSAGGALTGRAITWASRNPTIASVTPAGVVTGLAAGTATIEATADSVVGITTVVVSARPIIVDKVTVTLPESLLVTVGQTVQAVAVVTDPGGAVLGGQSISWASSDNAVATVSPLGVLTAVANGTTTITANAGGKSGTATLRVAISATPTGNRMTITATSLLIAETATTQTTVVVKDPFNNVLNPAITFTTSDPNVAVVSPAGTVTGVYAGFATITATGAGVSASLTIEVFPTSVSVVTITASVPTLPVGGTSQFAAQITDPQGNILLRPITWASNTPGIATVSASGIVQGVSLGSAIIVATSATVSARVTVNVTIPPVATVYLTAPQTTLQPTQSTQTAVVLRDLLGNVLTGRVITYSTSDPAIATVSATGLVTAVGPGTATITALSEGKTGTVSVTIPTVMSVTVSAPLTTLQIGQTTQAVAVLRDAQGNPVTGRAVTWTSSNPAALSVSASGLITAVGPGASTITATSGGVNGTLSVSVPTVTTVTVTASPSVLQPGQTSQASVVLLDGTGSVIIGRPITYSSANPAIATITASGLITAISPGTVQISALSDGVTGTMTITVPPVASVSVSAPLTTLQVGQTTQATATLRDAQGNAVSNRTVTWASSNPAAFTVSATGLITAVAPGSSQITATSEGITGSLTVGVPVVTTVLVTASPSTLQPGQTSQTSVVLLDGTGTVITGRPITYASPNPAVATVNASGLVTAVAGGTVQIAATSQGVTGTVTITVPPVASINVTATLTTLQPTQTTQATATLRDALGNPVSNRVITWASTNPAALTVTNTGLVTAVGPGTAQITVTSEGVTGSATMTVPPVALVLVSAANVSPTPGQTVQMSLALLDANSNAALNRTVVWASSVPGVATVSNTGLVTAVAVGTTTVTATSEGKVGSIVIQVVPVNQPPVVPPVATVSITASPSVLQPSQTTQTTVVLRDASNNVLTGRIITYSSSNSTIATVDGVGLVTALRSGSVQITATSEGQTGQVTITVPPVAQVIVTAPLTTLQIGQTTQASVTLRDAQGNPVGNRIVAWSSSNPAALSVSNSGLVTAVGPGAAQIIVTSEGVTGSVTITVPSVATVSISAPLTTLQPTQTTQTSVVLRDASNNVLTGRPITYASSNSSVASVDPSGLVTGIAGGTVQITATSEGKTGSVTITVPPVATVTVTAPLTTLQAGQTTQASAALRDAQGNLLSNRVVTWSSSNPTVMSVSATGFVTALSPGSANIIATSEGVNGSVQITMPAVATVYISAPITSLQPSQTTQSSVVLRDINGSVITGRPITYATSNPAVATVGAAGLVTGVAGGSVQISATADGKTGSMTITVPPVAQVIVTANAATLQPGQTTQASVTLLDAQGNPVSNRVATWSSSNPSAFTVSSSGLVTAVGPGSAQIVVNSEGASGSVAISVPAVATVTLNASTLALNPLQSAQLTATLVDVGSNPALNRTVTWSSSAPAVATVSSSGLVTGVSLGTATITATSEGKFASATVLVDQVVSSVTVTSPVPSLLVGQTAQLTAVVRDPFGTPITTLAPLWSTSDPARATITASGLITQVVPGGTLANVTFSATVRSVTGTISITMIGHPVEVPAALPLVFMNTALPPAPIAGGQVITASTSAQFANALTAARPGDVIELVNGVTFNGNFVMPNKNTSSTDWITIRPQTMTGLPAPGGRMRPSIALAANLPKLVSQTNSGALVTAPGAHHYRVIGLEVTVPSTVVNTGLVRTGDDGGNGQTTLASIPHDIVLDRLYIHGTTTGVVRRCLALNSASTAIIDSWLSDCHDLGSDAQAIAGWNGPGPYKIVNNYLEGSGENLIFGGTDPGVANLTPSDIEIRNNHFFKPTAWKGVWLVKNLLELKHAQRVLIEGNVFENNWQDGQGGTAILMKTVNQSGNCTWCITADVTFRYNFIKNVGSAFAIAGSPDNSFPDIPLTRVLIHDNVVANINPNTTFNGIGNGVLWGDIPSHVTFAHNTLISPTNTAMAMGPQGTTMNRISVRDNIIGGGAYGVKGAGATSGSGTLNMYMPNGSFVTNALILPSGAGYPATNFFPTSASAVGFTDLVGLDFRLSGSSNLRLKGTDGTDIGANVNAINTATAGVVVSP